MAQTAFLYRKIQKAQSQSSTNPVLHTWNNVDNYGNLQEREVGRNPKLQVMSPRANHYAKSSNTEAEEHLKEDTNKQKELIKQQAQVNKDLEKQQAEPRRVRDEFQTSLGWIGDAFYFLLF